ncbi:MAG: hypothetical protein IAI50_15995, partial [Candidatus Eremiobacteraeota bacterium]|nr:hypothetical protein [Candidatus Eremiobacteraeota bacterium]
MTQRFYRLASTAIAAGALALAAAQPFGATLARAASLPTPGEAASGDT